eukprot:2636346-Rhodomonas_salina.4
MLVSCTRALVSAGGGEASGGEMVSAGGGEEKGEDGYGEPCNEPSRRGLFKPSHTRNPQTRTAQTVNRQPLNSQPLNPSPSTSALSPSTRMQIRRGGGRAGARAVRDRMGGLESGAGLGSKVEAGGWRGGAETEWEECLGSSVSGLVSRVSGLGSRVAGGGQTEWEEHMTRRCRGFGVRCLGSSVSGLVSSVSGLVSRASGGGRGEDRVGGAHDEEVQGFRVQDSGS